MAKPKKPDPRDMPITLETYGDQIDDAFGDSFMFAETVIELQMVKARMAVLSTRRDQIYNEIKVQYARGARGNGRWFLRESHTPARTTRTVPSAAVKAADKGLWERARALKPWVSVKAAGDYVPPAVSAPLQMPAVPKGYAGIGEVIHAYKAPVFEEIAALKHREDELKVALRVIDANTGHDGTERRFTDGWAVMTTRLEYDADLLKRVDPVAWQRLLEEKTTPATSRIVLMDRLAAQDAGYLEIGDIEYAD